MDINTMVEEFLISKPDGYRKDIQIFFNSLESRNLPLIKEVIQGIRTENIIESLNYYKANNNLASVSTAKRYIAAVSEFFKYIISNNYIDNKEFFEELILPTTINKSYMYKLNEYISKDKDLKNRDTFEIFKDEDVEELVKNCDEVLSWDEAIIIYRSKEYNKFLSALCIKLIIYNGIMYRNLREITHTEDIYKYNKIRINNFRISLPEKYSQQLKKYLNIRKVILENNNNKKSDKLFITFKGDQLPTTTYMSAFLATCTGRNDLNGLIKYAIRNMIMVGVNDSVIKRFTGASREIIEQASYNGDSYDELYWNRYLDSRIRNLELFDLL